MAKTVRIWFSRKPAPNLGLFEIFKDGTGTEELVNTAEIRNILTHEEFKLFMSGVEIFLIPAERFRTRKHKDKKKPYGGKKATL